MPPRSAGNPNMGSRIDASASSSMGDVFQMFSTGNASWGARITNEAERKEGALRVGGLGPEVTEAAIQAFFGKFYRTVKAARKTTTSSAVVTFGYAGERDRALLEMQGRELMGHSLQCHKDRETDLLEAPVKKTLRDDEIHAMLVEREAARSRRDYPGADALADRLKQAGVLLDRTGGTWRAADGRTGLIPAAPPRGGGGGGGGARGPRAPPTAEETARTLLVELGGDQSCGTGTLGKIFAPFNVASVTGGRDGYARLAFADADAAAAALAVAHYTPTGRRLVGV